MTQRIFEFLSMYDVFEGSCGNHRLPGPPTPTSPVPVVMIGFVADKMVSDKSLETPTPAHSASYINKQPPPFGHQLLEYFSFDPGYVNLNHGSLSS
jgi:hypothetical protein